MKKNNTPGATFDVRRGKWIAQIKINGKNKFLGYFETRELAVSAKLQFKLENEDKLNLYSKEKDLYKKEVVELYRLGKTISEISKIYNKDYSTIYELLQKQGIALRYDNIKITDALSKIIVDKYVNEKSSSLKLESELNVSATQILKCLHDNGVNPRRRIYEFIDENFMKKIDENWKAYFLGLFYADGCMRSLRNKQSPSISIDLTIKDSYILDVLCNKIFKKFRLKEYPSKKYLDKKTNKVYTGKPSKRININSKIVYNDLLSYGCSPAKSITVEYPKNLSLNYFSHFMRGYFDGDGCVHQKPIVTICCSQSFAISLQQILKDSFNIESNIVKRKKIYSLNIYKKAEVGKFYKLIYSECENIFLHRKKDRFDKFFA